MKKVDVLNTPVYSAEPEKNVRFFDFGKDAFAVLELQVFSEEAQEITISVGEVRNGDRIKREPGGSRIFQEEKVMLSPGGNYVKMTMLHGGYNDGTLKIEPNAVPFRYAEVCGNVTLKQIYQHAYFGRFDDDASDFTSSSAALDKLWEFCKYTMKATTPFGIFIDGNRERQAYEGDTYINQLGYFVCTSDTEIAAKTIDRLFAYPTWPTEWRLSMIPIVHDYALYTGDTASLERWYDQLRQNLLMDGVDERGLLNAGLVKNAPKSLGINNVVIPIRDIVDWPLGERDGYEMGEVNLVPNCWYQMALRRMAEIADLCGKKEDAAFFRESAEKSKQAIRQYMLKNGLFTDNPESDNTALHSCIYPALWGVAEEAEKKELLCIIRQKGMACSVFTAQFLLECCYSNGMGDYGFELMTSTGKRSWNNMISCGATIAMEAWDDSFKPNQDWNHPWGAAPGNIIIRFLAGIRPLEPGFKTFLVDPQPAGLTHFKAKTPTPYGAITLQLEPDGTYKLNVPENTCAICRGRKYAPGYHVIVS